MTKTIPPPPPIQRRHLQQTDLSFSQESMWFLQQLDPENIAYNSTYLIKFTGGIDHSSLERALNDLVQRHAPLRTVYPNQGGSPVQVIQPFDSFSLPLVDFSGLPEHERLQAICSYASERGNQPYNLQRGPLLRYALLHSNFNLDYLFFSTHHIGFDAWSRQILFNDLMQIYNAFRSGKEAALSELPIEYADYALWQREWLSGERLEAYLEHWKDTLSGDLPILELPTDRPRPALQSYRGARHYFRLSQALSSQMKDFCQRERLTPFQLLLATYALLLMRYSGQEDIIMGCPFANRSRSELDGVVGLFVNTLPIRVNLQGNPSVRKFLDHVRGVLLDAFTWQAAPFEALVSGISPKRDLSRTPVFQVVINLRNVPKRPISTEGWEIETSLRENDPSPFDLSLEFDDDKDGSLDASLLYNIALYDENTIVRMAAHFQNLLSELLVKIDRPIAELEMLIPAEWKRIVIDWNNTGKEFPQVCIQDLFTEQADKNPEALAIVCNGNSLTYGDLEKKANQLAQYLKLGGMEAEARVGIFLPRSEKIVVALLAILKAGSAYVPLDLTYPAERIAYVVQDSDPTAIITLSHLSDQLPDQIRKICLDTETDLIDSCDSGRPISITNNNSLAYVIYTSGSTGRPKGAMNVHKGIVNYLVYMNQEYQFTAADRLIQLTSLSFDVSAFEIFGTLSYGGTMFLMDDAQMRDPDFICAAVIEHQATYISCVPTMLRALCESALRLQPEKNNLRLLLPVGEALREADVGLVRRAFGESVKLVNQYGPTETSIIHTNYLVPTALPNGIQIVPIGKPISNARAYVLDNYFNPVPVGVKGELFIGGIGVGRGYWNQPGLTAKWFLPDPFSPGDRMYRSGDIVQQLSDGTICFLGRSDNQVKFRGYRVELGEIEAVVSEFPGVKDAVVVLWRQDDSEALAAYITVSKGDRKQIKEILRAYLADRLPFYMLPSSIMVLDEMPLTPGLKIDRRALPLPEKSIKPDGYIAPRNDIEKRLVSIWKAVLDVERVGVQDNFFDLGGHSLLAVRLFTRINEEFDQSIPLLQLFQDGTVESLAAILSGEKKNAPLDGVIPIQTEGNEPPLFVLSAGLYMRELALALGPTRPVYGLYLSKNGQILFQGSVKDAASIYYRSLINFYPDGPYLLLGHSALGLFALELARLLRKNGKVVAFLGLLDTYPPGHGIKVKLIDRVKFHLFNLRYKSLAEKVEYLRLRIARRVTRWRGHQIDDRSTEPDFEVQFEIIGRFFANAYSLEHYDGQVTIFSVTLRSRFIRGDPMENWAKTFTGPYEIVKIPGNHMSMLQPPHVAILADKIKAILRKGEVA